MRLHIVISAFLMQIVEAQYGEVGPPSPSPPTNYYNPYPPCDHYAVHPETPAHPASSPSSDETVPIPVQKSVSGPITPKPQNQKPGSKPSMLTSVPTEQTKLRPTEIPPIFSQASFATPSKISKLTSRSSRAPSKAPLTTRQSFATRPEKVSPTTLKWSTEQRSTSTSRKISAKSVTQQHASTVSPVQEQQKQKIQSVNIPPHTPINPPSLPEGELAKGIPPNQIPPIASKNEIAPNELKEVPEEKFRYTDCISDTLFVVDSTSSVRRYFERHREYVLNTVNLLEAIGQNGTRIGVIVYSSKLRSQIKIPFGKHKNRTEIEIAIKELPYFSGITATGAALNLTLQALRTRRPNVPTNVVVITDGFSYDIVDGPAAELHRLPNVRTFTVTVTDAWREYELQTIAGNPHRVFKGMGSIRDLVTALKSCNDGPRKGDILPEESTIDSFLSSQPSKATTVTSTTAASSIASIAQKQTTTVKPLKDITNKIKPTPSSVKSESSSSSRSSSSSSEEEAKAHKPSRYFPSTTVGATSLRQSSQSSTTVSSSPSRPSTSRSSSTTKYSTTPKRTTVTKQQTLTTRTPETTSRSTATLTSEATTKVTVKAASLAPFKASAKGCLFDLVIVLDASGSLQSRFQRQLELTIRLIDRLTIGPEDARVAVIKYAGPQKSKVVIPFSKYTDKQSLEAAVRKVGFIGGTTYTNEALQKVDAELSGPAGRRSHASTIVIVFTDGFSHDDPVPGATVLRNKGIPVYTVGINDVYPLNKKELLDIAGDETRVFLDKNIAQFENNLAELTKGCVKKQ